MKFTLKLGLTCWALTLAIAAVGTALGHKGLITMGPCGGNGYFFLFGMIVTFGVGCLLLVIGSFLWTFRKFKR